RSGRPSAGAAARRPARSGPPARHRGPPLQGDRPPVGAVSLRRAHAGDPGNATVAPDDRLGARKRGRHRVSGQDSKLPILEELGAEFSRLVEVELGRAAISANGHERRQRARLPQRPPARRASGARRVARRAVVVLVLLCLVGGIALAARFASDGGVPANTKPATLAAADSWRLLGYRDEGRLCLLFASGGELGGECGAAPRPDGVRATSLALPQRRFVLGLAGSRVKRVEVRIGARSSLVRTRRPSAAGRAAGVPADVRWFVASTAGGGPLSSAPA